MDKLMMGSGISAGEDIRIAIDIIDVNPVRYDGNTDEYLVCEPKNAQYTLIRANDINGDMIYLMLKCGDGGKCSNTFLLADAIQDG